MQSSTRGLSRLLALLIAAWSCQTASAVDVVWSKMSGSGLDIASNEAGQPWLIGLDRISEAGYSIYSDSNGNWIKRAGAGTRIALDLNGRPWMVDEQRKIHRYDAGSSSWQTMPGSGTDIAAGGDGSIWLLGATKVTGGYSVFKWDSTAQNWSPMTGAGVRIAVEKGGSPWVVNENGDIFRYDLQLRSWSLKPGKARSVHAGMGSGTVWVIGTEAIASGYSVSRYIPSTQSWEPYGTFGAVSITEVHNTPWIVQSDGSIYSKAAEIIISNLGEGTITITPTPQTPTPQALQVLGTPQPGKLLCSQTGMTTCGDTKADYVGAFALDTTCDEGFYDMIWGGTCWKCPDDSDGRGSWIRSATAIDKDDACWRVPKDTTGKAIKVRSPAWAWDCPSGSFWDGFSPDGIGGSCWKCPDDLPRRTAAAVWADNACASSLNETKPATLLSFNGCPTPNAANMSLPGKRSPGRPFLDIAAGWNQGIASGACYACPIADEAGNFLITERNANPLYDKDANTGCTIKLKWQPPPFPEPGLTYMQGVKDLIWEQRLFDGDKITGFLYDLAESRGLGDATPEAKAWVAARWQEIASKPYNSEPLRIFVFAHLKTALAKNTDQRSPAEKKLIESFANYVRQRRTYLAEQGLAMYDAWKAHDDLYRQNTGQTKQLGQYFYYGTVPLDFHGTLGQLMSLGGFGGGLIGSMYAAHQFASGVQFGPIVDQVTGATIGQAPVHSTQIGGLTKGLNILKSGAHGLTALSGATLIQTAFAILTSIAVDQFMAIQGARPKLEASLEQAKRAVNLNELSNAKNGEDMLYFFWAKAMDITDLEDSQVVQLAAQAQARAQQGGYLAPPKIALTISGETSVGDRIVSGSSGVAAGNLTENQKLVSKNAKYEALMQPDGNFVIYTGNKQAIWATGTMGKGSRPYRLAIQADGNLVVYGSSGATWASGIRSGTAPFTLIMQDDANLVIYDSANRAIWASNTQR